MHLFRDAKEKGLSFHQIGNRWLGLFINPTKGEVQIGNPDFFLYFSYGKFKYCIFIIDNSFGDAPSTVSLQNEFLQFRYSQFRMYIEITCMSI